VKAADFTQIKAPNESGDEDPLNDANGKEEQLTREERKIDVKQARFNPDFRFNIEIHLPSNGTEETYLAIFNALRKSLG